MPLTAGTKAPQFCLNSQISVDNFDTAPLKLRQKTGFLNKVLSPDNNADWNQITTSPIGGKAAPGGTNTGQAVETTIEYRTPYCAGGTTPGSASEICAVTGSNTEEKGYLYVDVDKFVERSFDVDLADFDATCEAPNDRIADQIARKAYEMRREINSDGIDDYHGVLSAYPVSGLTPTGANLQDINVISDEGNIINAGFAKARGTFRHALWDGGVQMVGGNRMGTYFDVRAMQGLSHRRGADGTLEDPFSNTEFAFDLDLDSRIGTLESASDSYVLAWADGAFGMVEWMENTAYKNYVFEDHIRDTITVDGMEFDYFVHFDKCTTPKWRVMLRKYYGWMAIPDTAYCNNNGLRFMYKSTAGAITSTHLDPA